MATIVQDPIVINNQEVLPGEQKDIKIDIARLPSGTRINLNIKVFRSKRPGPCIMVLAGVHGDEINGVEIVRNMIQTNLFDSITRGTIIAVPLLNIYGFNNFSRDVHDGKDVNRSFPGSRGGSLASKVANTVTKHLLPHVDLAIDYHTGGGDRYNFPQIRYTKGDLVSKELAETFAAPFLIAYNTIPKSFRKVAFDMGIPTLVFEGGEALRWDSLSISKGITGMRRVLKSFKMVKTAPKPKHASIHLATTKWLRSPRSGLFLWMKSSGEYIKQGDLLGVLNDPYGEKNFEIVAKKAGYIFGHNNAAVVNSGDALFHIGYT